MYRMMLILCITTKLLPYILSNYGLDITSIYTYPWGYTPIIASLLYTTKISEKLIILLIPDILISIINPEHAIYDGQIINYILLLISTSNHHTITPITSNIVYFILSNLSVWFYMYETNINGLLSCYINAIPFFTANIVSTVFYTILFQTLNVVVTPQYLLKSCYKGK